MFETVRDYPTATESCKQAYSLKPEQRPSYSLKQTAILYVWWQLPPVGEWGHGEHLATAEWLLRCRWLLDLHG